MGKRRASQLALAKELIEHAGQEALDLVGGDRSRVAWLKQRASKRGSGASAVGSREEGRPATATKHALVAVAPNRPSCQVCRDICRCMGVPQLGRDSRKFTSRTKVEHSAAGSVVSTFALLVDSTTGTI